MYANNISSGRQYGDLTENVYFKATFATLLSIVFMLSVAGGFLVCHVIVTHRLLKKRIWLYLLLLAMSDTSVCLVAIPIMIAACIDEGILLQTWLCNLSLSSMLFFGSWSVFTITAISVHKYKIISNPLESIRNEGYQEFIIYICISLVLSLRFVVPPNTGFGVGFMHIEERKWCVISSQSKTHGNIILSVIGIFAYCIPLCVILVFSIRTYLAFRRHSYVRKNIRRMSSVEVFAEKRAIVQTLFVIVCVFVALWTPLLLSILIGVTGIECPLLFTHLAFLLVFLQGSVNPMIYVFRHRVFKDFLKKMFRRKVVEVTRIISFHEHSKNRRLRSLSTQYRDCVVEARLNYTRPEGDTMVSSFPMSDMSTRH